MDEPKTNNDNPYNVKPIMSEGNGLDSLVMSDDVPKKSDNSNYGKYALLSLYFMMMLLTLFLYIAWILKEPVVDESMSTIIVIFIGMTFIASLILAASGYIKLSFAFYIMIVVSFIMNHAVTGYLSKESTEATPGLFKNVNMPFIAECLICMSYVSILLGAFGYGMILMDRC